MIRVRAFGLPYPKRPQTKLLPAPSPPEDNDESEDEFDPESESPDPLQQKRAEELKQAMVRLLSAVPGSVRDAEVNRKYSKLVADRWLQSDRLRPENDGANSNAMCLKVVSALRKNGQRAGQQTMWLIDSQRGRIEHQNQVDNEYVSVTFDNEECDVRFDPDAKPKRVSLSEARDYLPALQAMALAELLKGIGTFGAEQEGDRQSGETAFASFGSLLTEGAGKAGERLAWRIKALDFDLDETYLWFSVNSKRNGLMPRLAKIANDKDSQSGAVRFEDWRPLSDGHLPHRYIYVQSLSEETVLEVVVESIDWVPLNASGFEGIKGASSND